MAMREAIETCSNPASMPPWYKGEVSSVLNGLMSRQAALAGQLVDSPGIWNHHVAPLILRAMVENVISTRWLLKEPVNRCREYVGYGLGQAKLAISHFQKKMKETPDDYVPEKMIEIKQMWIESQRFMAFVDVNLGSWSGTSVRKMAIESGDEDLYNFAFTPFSSCVHSTWEHIHIFNTVRCDNPLHKWHHAPALVDFGSEPDYVFRAAKYFDLTIDSIAEAASLDFSGKAREFVRKNEHTLFSDDANGVGASGQEPGDEQSPA